MRDICFIDKTFDSTQTNNYHLTVQISPDGFFFTVLDVPKGKYIVLNGYNFFIKRSRLLFKHVKEVVEKEELIRLNYKSVDVLYSTRLFTFVPKVLFSDGDAEIFLSFNHKQEKGFAIRKNLFRRSESWCIYNFPQNLSDYLETVFPKATVSHNLFPLVEAVLESNRNFPERQQVHLNFFREYFEIVVISGQKLMQCNIFNYKTERDILYYVLYAFDQMKLSPENTDLIIHGIVPQVSPVYHLLKRYIRKTAFAKLNTTYQYSYTFCQLPEHYFSSLLSCYKCE
jgi:hypothetical protein